MSRKNFDFWFSEHDFLHDLYCICTEKFRRKVDLLAKILSEGPKIKKKVVHDLYESIPGRLLNVYKLDGEMISK